MLWLAYEPKFAANAKAELAWLQANAAGNPLITDHILPRAMRRLVATGKADDLNACCRLRRGDERRRPAPRFEGLAVALQGRQIDAPAAWSGTRERNSKPIRRRKRWRRSWR